MVSGYTLRSKYFIVNVKTFSYHHRPSQVYNRKGKGVGRFTSFYYDDVLQNLHFVWHDNNNNNRVTSKQAINAE